MSGTIAVAGSVAQRPGYGGHTWVFLQYLLGFRRLGWDVVFLDRLDSAMGVGDAGPRYLVDVMKEFGLADAFGLLDERGEPLAGLPRRELLDLVRRSAFLLNVNGFLDDSELLAAAPSRVYLDIDPGLSQIWHELGLADPFAGHDVFVTIAERIGRADCIVPTCGLDWIATPHPVVLEQWPARAVSAEGSFRGIGSWRGPYGPVEYRGRTLGLRVHEFRRFVELPQRSDEQFEVALDIDPADSADIELLAANRWRLVDPQGVAGDPAAYRAYIQGAKAELLIAKNLPVQTNSGWFSDRSGCFLASAKPVLAQDTGLEELYPTGEGLLTFTTLDEAVAGVEEISRNYERHARAARAIAEQRLDSDLVLGRLLEMIGVS